MNPLTSGTDSNDEEKASNASESNSNDLVRHDASGWSFLDILVNNFKQDKTSSTKSSAKFDYHFILIPNQSERENLLPPVQPSAQQAEQAAWFER